jgi:hypothetical protein
MVMQQTKFPARPTLNRSKTFIWLPFAGGISAFAVILPKPMGTGYGVGGGYPDASHVNGCYAETLDGKTGNRSFMSDPAPSAMAIIYERKWCPMKPGKGCSYLKA